MNIPLYMLILIILVVSAVAAVVGYLVRKSIAEAKIVSAEHAANQIVEDAKRDAEANRIEVILEATDEVHTLRTEAEREVREPMNVIPIHEHRLEQ